MNTNTLQLVEKFGGKVEEYLHVLADKLGTTAEHVYGVLIKQQYIVGFTHLFTLLTVIFITLLCLKTTYSWFKYTNTTEECDHQPNGWQIFVLIVGILCAVISLIVGTVELPNIISKIFNPEYHAIQNLADMIK